MQGKGHTAFSDRNVHVSWWNLLLPSSWHKYTVNLWLRYKRGTSQ